jgi:adenine phosphoribosyltransferase
VAEPAVGDRIRAAVRDVPDFPKPGILFKDITPVLRDGALLRAVVESLADTWRAAGIQRVAAIESRGFLFGAPLAVALGAGFAPVRKPGKLPWQTIRVDYTLEYGADALEAHSDALVAGERVLIVDDVLATGGTAAGAVELVRTLGGEVAGAAFVLELGFLGGRRRLGEIPLTSLVYYD